MEIRQHIPVISVALVALWLLAFPTSVLGTPPPPSLVHDTLSPPPPVPATAQTAGARFNLTWNTGCLTPSAEAVTALTYAADLWSSWISSTVPIDVMVCWTSQLAGGDALGTGMPTSYVSNFPGAALVDVQYPIALANALAGTDLKPNQADMRLAFDADTPWHYTTGRQAAATEYDFVTVALHELAHGLGFVGNIYESGSVGFCGDGPYGSLYPCPTPYDWFTVDSTTIPLLDYKTLNPLTLGARLKSDANFGGPNAIAANQNSVVKLCTPSIFAFGTSLSHLDPSTYDGTDSQLMLPSYSSTTRSPGPVTLGIMQDMGWVRADGAASLTTAGPLTAAVGEDVTLTSTFIWPGYVGQTLTYTWTTDNATPIAHTHASAADEITLSWETAGIKTVELVAAAPDGAASAGTVRTLRIIDAADMDLAVTGPANGSTGQPYTFNAAVAPANASLPVTYTWQATGQSTVVHPNIYGADSQSYTWTMGGMKTLTVSAAVNGTTITSDHRIDIDEPELDHFIFLPLAIKSH